MDYRLYHHRELGAFECLGCRELIEIVSFAWLKIGGLKQRVRVKGNPENMQLFRELHEMDHKQCHLFKDADKAKAAREFRKESTRRKLTGEGRGLTREQARARAAYVLGSDDSGARMPRPTGPGAR